MDSERHDRIRALFLQAGERPEEERAAFLEEACAGDEGLRREVLELLGFDRTEAAVDRRLSPTELAPPISSAPSLPERIGPFRVLGVLGEGGMGVVYLAEQEHPRREVALKVLRSGIGTEQAVRRFEFEVEVLGRLQHPGIATLLEAGFTGSGFGRCPYFAMERIDGRPLHEHLQQTHPGLRERIELLIEICEVVQYAHLQGVIHRDLKPSNILVDARGRARILDFGIARFSDSEEATAATHTGQIIGTLPYMSPEQTLGSSRSLDARSDVYSLGVLAYQTLGGRLPLPVDGLGLTAALRRIQDESPPRLGSLRGELRGDLEVIVGKALEKLPADRYESAAALTEDLRRHLHHEPILARAPTTLYQLRKLVRRHRTLAAAVAVAFAAVLSGAGIAWWKAEEARASEERAQSSLRQSELDRADAVLAREEAEAALSEAERSREQAEEASTRAGVAQRRAEDEARAANAVVAFLVRMLGSLKPDEMGRKVLVDDVLRVAAAELRTDLDDQSLTKARLHHALGESFLALSRIPPADEQLALAQEQYERAGLPAEDLRRSQLRVDRLRLVASRRMAEEVVDQGLDLIEEFEQVYGPDHGMTLQAIQLVGEARRDLGDFAGALKLFERNLAIARRNPRVQLPLHKIQVHVASMLARVGEPERAERLLQEVIEEARGLHGDGAEIVMDHRYALALHYDTVGRFPEAEREARRLLEDFRTVHGEEHHQTVLVQHLLAKVLALQGQLDEALPLMDRVMAWTRARMDVLAESFVLERLQSEVNLQYMAGRLEAALGATEDLLEQHELRLGEEHQATMNAAWNHGVLLIANGHRELAEAHLRRYVDISDRALGREHPLNAQFRMNLANVCQSSGRVDEAAALMEGVVELFQRLNGPDNKSTVDAIRVRAGLRRKQGRFAEARELNERALRALQRTRGPLQQMTMETLRLCGANAADAGQPGWIQPLAREWWQRIVALPTPPARPAVETTVELLRFHEPGDEAGAELEELLYEALERAESEENRAAIPVYRLCYGLFLLRDESFADAEETLHRAFEEAPEQPIELRGLVAARLVELYQAMEDPDSAAEWSKWIREVATR